MLVDFSCLVSNLYCRVELKLRICNVVISKVLPICMAVFMVIYWIAGLANLFGSARDSTTRIC